MVSTVDKKDLIAYVRGEIDTTPQLRSASDLGTADASAAAGSAAGAHAKAATADRKRKAEDERKPDDRKKQSRPSTKAYVMGLLLFDDTKPLGQRSAEIQEAFG